jgi:hypothetical protein
MASPIMMFRDYTNTAAVWAPFSVDSHEIQMRR